MTEKVTVSNIYQMLSQIKHPEIGNRNLVELAMIPEVKIDGNSILITLALPDLEGPARQTLSDLVRKPVVEMLDGQE